MKRDLYRGIAISLTPAVLLFSIFFLLPLGAVLYTSFFDWSLAGLSFVGLENYREMFDERAFQKAVRNNLIWSAAVVLLHVPLATGVAILLSEKMRGWKVFRTLFFIPNMISWAALALIYRNVVYNPQWGLLNSVLGRVGLESWQRQWLADLDWALPAVIATWMFNIGLWMVIIMAEIAGIPDNLYEAAEIDGASRPQQVRHITLPLLRNVIGTCMILSVSIGLVSFEVIFLMTEGGPANETLNLAMHLYNKFTFTQFGYANAIGVFLIGLGFLLMTLINRTFRVGEQV